ncbi:protein PXR1-like [Lactuca sativa]|uniref:protein PXR1-like n=1 Tax=Lactuca sativa TaxID=4236 RepID=UPI000CD855C5|nr:protein PXR1-like [Lactuca sativa]
MEEESKLSIGGLLAIVSKVTEKEAVENGDSDDEEGFIMNSDDEAIAFCSNNRVKKIFKKPFNPKVRQSEVKGRFVNKAVGEEKKKKIEKKDGKVDEDKSERKLKGDSGVDCHYYNGENHQENDCMLRKKDKRKNKVNDEAYHTERLEEVRVKAKRMSLVARGEYEEDGMYQI